MEKQTVTCPEGKLLKRDYIQSLITSVVAALIGGVYESVSAAVSTQGGNAFEVDWRLAISAGITAGLAHLYRKFKQDEGGNFKPF